MLVAHVLFGSYQRTWKSLIHIMILLFDIHEIKGKTSTKSVSKYILTYVQFIHYFSDNASENDWKMDYYLFSSLFPSGAFGSGIKSCRSTGFHSHSLLFCGQGLHFFASKITFLFCFLVLFVFQPEPNDLRMNLWTSEI